MSKICKKRVHVNEKMSLPCAFGKCPGSLHFTLLTVGWHWTIISSPWKLTGYPSVYNSYVKRKGVCVLQKWSLRVSAPHSQIFWMSLHIHNLQPFFYQNNNFQIKKFDVLRQNFDRKLIYPNMSRDMQKHVWLVHVTDSYFSGKRNLNKVF